MPRFSIYADLSRALTEAERSAVAGALDDAVAGGGCVGAQRHGEELFFALEAPDVDAARVEGERLAREVLRRAEVQDVAVHIAG